MPQTRELQPFLEKRILKNQRRLARLERKFWRAQYIFVYGPSEDLIHVKTAAKGLGRVCDQVYKDIVQYQRELQSAAAPEVA